jgi:hypothetical protein
VQAPLSAPRESLTLEDVIYLIQESDAPKYSLGCELLDLNLAVMSDITEWVAAEGSVTRNSFATIHATCSLRVSTPLDWGQAIVRPYVTLSDGDLSAAFYLGAYFAYSPEKGTETNPIVYEVEGYDILTILNDLVGESYAVAEGDAYLTRVEEILVERGLTQYNIDPEGASKVLPSAKTWSIEEDVTWLTIVNELLNAIGYQGIWSDWEGRIQCVPYENPRDRASEWHYDVDPLSSMLSPNRVDAKDFFDAPNRWVAVRTNNVDGPAPVEGDGIYTYVNQSLGPTSVDARGRTITAPIIRADVADQDGLVAVASTRIDADMRIGRTLSLSTFPNPLHWHFDRISISDPLLDAVILEAQATSWTFDLGGGDMNHEWAVL